MKVTVDHVVVAHRIASVTVIDDGGRTHRIGHHPSYPGWRCLRCDNTTCPYIAAAMSFVIDLEEPT